MGSRAAPSTGKETCRIQPSWPTPTPLRYGRASVTIPATISSWTRSSIGVRNSCRIPLPPHRLHDQPLPRRHARARRHPHAGIRRRMGHPRHPRMGRGLVGNADRGRQSGGLYHRRRRGRSGHAPERVRLPEPGDGLLRLVRPPQQVGYRWPQLSFQRLHLPRPCPPGRAHRIGGLARWIHSPGGPGAGCHRRRDAACLRLARGFSQFLPAGPRADCRKGPSRRRPGNCRPLPIRPAPFP